MAIERLSLLDTVTASTYFAVNVNNQDYRTAADTVAQYIQSQGAAGDGKTVTALTINLNGALGVGTPTTISSGGFFRLRFEPILKTWYRVG